MDTQSQQNKREKLEDKKEEEGKEELSRKNQRPTSTTTTNHTSSPPSTSSPSHEFSFTISLHPSTTTTTTTEKCNPPPSFAIDLSPADDIFFHGHLLPLHLLSHSSISPRTSTTSLDSLNFPLRGFDNHKPTTTTSTTTTTTTTTATNNNNTTSGTNGRNKSKSFSLFGLAKWRKTFEMTDREEERKKVRLDIRRIIKQYARVVRGALFFKGGEKEKGELRRQPHSFSGNLNSRWKEWGGRRGGIFSAPASMRTSPTNSGLLLATATISSSNDSTMEELQSAIQAAIAHCKNSIAAQEDKCKC
ncbi:BRI1 kinase inhibitor 1 [Tasmannia lanceolata]|uniref:BRI1 kinase inhibitor 1 n=1 Tax=Tasmannia lanceolata TaxID=3420 RepID=UPI004063EC7E